MPKKAKGSSSRSYKIFITDEFLKNLKCARSQIGKIEQKLSSFVFPQLKQNPFYGLNIKRLKGYQPLTWRYRVADWRFFYEIDEKKKTVYLIAAHHRKEAYR
jgi:mRNA interferase RelE/StbE